MADLTDIKGLGPAKIEKLKAAGVSDIRALAELDLRKRTDIPIGNDVLKRAKTQARRLLTQEGKGFEKAPYGDDAPAASGKGRATKAPAKKGAAKKSAAKKGAAKGAASNGAPAAKKGAAPKRAPAAASRAKAEPAPAASPAADGPAPATRHKPAKKGLWSRILRR